MRSLSIFVDACRYGSFSRAAKENYMTVQNVSKAISDMERDAGLRLFERTCHGVSPTAAGRALLPFAEGVLREAAAWEDKVDLVRAALRFGGLGPVGE